MRSVWWRMVAAGGGLGQKVSETNLDNLGRPGVPIPNVLENLIQFYGNDNDANLYLNESVSKYYDFLEMCKDRSFKGNPIFLSINIQSLNSKLHELKSFLAELENNKINIIAIALQEIWQIQHTDLVQIPNFNFINLQRNNQRGGGVGFYLSNKVTFKKLENLSCMHDKVFECLTVEIDLNSKKYVLSSIYRSPSLLNEFTISTVCIFRTFSIKLKTNDCLFSFF
jgi:hypothetical protein